MRSVNRGIAAFWQGDQRRALRETLCNEAETYLRVQGPTDLAHGNTIRRKAAGGSPAKTPEHR